MGNSLESYFDFAENDYLFFRQAYDSNVRGSALAALGQNICERYLKHIISEYAIPDSNIYIPLFFKLLSPTQDDYNDIISPVFFRKRFLLCF